MCLVVLVASLRQRMKKKEFDMYIQITLTPQNTDARIEV